MFTLIDLVHFCFAFPMRINIFLWSHHSWSTVTSENSFLTYFFSSMSVIYFVCPPVLSQQTSSTGLALSQISYRSNLLHMIFLQTSNMCYKSLNIDLMVTCISAGLYLLFWNGASNLLVLFFFLWSQFILQSMRKFMVSRTTDLPCLILRVTYSNLLSYIIILCVRYWCWATERFECFWKCIYSIVMSGFSSQNAFKRLQLYFFFFLVASSYIYLDCLW